ncbi:hypothetical protein V6N13_095143 [Hibiscus sabdariffa]
MKICKGRLETNGGFGLKTRKGRPEYAELGIPQGLASFDCSLVSDLAPSGSNGQIAMADLPTADSASFDQNFILDLVSLDTGDQTTVVDSASFGQSVTCDPTSLDTSERIARTDSASFDQSHRGCLASMDRGRIQISHHWVQMGRPLLLRLSDLGSEGRGHRSGTQ